MTDRCLHLTVDYCTYCMYMTYQPIVLSKMRIRPSKKSLLDHCSSGSRVFAILSRENGQSCSLFIFPNSEILHPKSPADKFSDKLVDSRSKYCGIPIGKLLIYYRIPWSYGGSSIMRKIRI